MGGGDQHGVGDTRAQPVDLQPVVVDGHSLDRETGADAEDGMEGERGILDGDGRPSQLSKCLGEDRERFGESAEDDDLVGMGAHCSRPTQVRGERDSELANTTRVAVAEQIVGRPVHCVADGREPRPARKRRTIGLAGPEVRAVAARRGRGLADRNRRVGRSRDARARTWFGDEDAFGDELLVRPDDSCPRPTQLGGQRSCRGQSRAARQLTGRNGVAKGSLQTGLATLAASGHDQELEQSGLPPSIQSGLVDQSTTSVP